VKPRDIALALAAPILWGVGFTFAKPALTQSPPMPMMVMIYVATARVPIGGAIILVGHYPRGIVDRGPRGGRADADCRRRALSASRGPRPHQQAGRRRPLAAGDDGGDSRARVLSGWVQPVSGYCRDSGW